MSTHLFPMKQTSYSTLANFIVQLLWEFNLIDEPKVML